MSQQPEATGLPDHAENIREASIYGRLPLLPEEREYDTRGAYTMCFAYAVATWCFLTGGYVAAWMKLRPRERTISAAGASRASSAPRSRRVIQPNL